VKFLFAYRDSSNERHDGIVVASSKDDAFKKLRARGIRPFFVAPAPGALNKLSALGKRGFAIVALIIVALALLAALIDLHRSSRPAAGATQSFQGNDAQKSFDVVVGSRVRRQPIGDVAVIDAGIRSGWADVFELEGERFLASFAIPGASAAIRSTSENEI
jgi:hypothetical protein